MEPSNMPPHQQQQQLPCPSQSLLFDLACDTHFHHQRLRSHDEVNVYLCLTCGSPVFRDDDEQESDLTSPFCLDCFSTFHDDYNDPHDDASLTDMDADADDDDDDHEDYNHFHVSCHAGSVAFECLDLPSSMGFGFLTGGNATMSAA